MRDGVDKFEEGLTNTDRVWNRVRTRTNGTFDPYQGGSEVLIRGGSDLTADYHDLAVAVQGLGFLESGITDPLNHFSNTLLEFSAILRHTVILLFSVKFFFFHFRWKFSLDTDVYRPISCRPSLTAFLFAREPCRAEAPRSEAAGLRRTLGLPLCSYLRTWSAGSRDLWTRREHRARVSGILSRQDGQHHREGWWPYASRENEAVRWEDQGGLCISRCFHIVKKLTRCTVARGGCYDCSWNIRRLQRWDAPWTINIPAWEASGDEGNARSTGRRANRDVQSCE